MNMTEGNVKKTILRFALPMILSLITQQLYNVADMIIVGHYLGVNELAAVGNAGTIVSILVTLSGGLEMGSEVIFSKFIGSERYKDIVTGTKSILLFGLISGLCITVMGITLKAPILRLIQVPANLSSDTGIYYNIYLAGLTGIFLYDISRAILVSLGNPKLSMFLVILTSLLNVGMDLLFICVWNMGVGGAAFATILSQIIGMLLSLYLLRRKMRPYTQKYHFRGIETAKIKEILSISIPTILQQLLLSLSSMLLMALVNPYGSEIISGYITANKIILFGIVPVIGTCQALSVFTAANSGGGRTSRIREGYYFCMVLTGVYISIIVASNFLLIKSLIGIFVDIERYTDAFKFARNYLQYSSLVYFLYGWKIINESLMRGFMRMKEYLCSNLSDLFGKVIITILLVSLFSQQGFWMGNAFGKIISFAISTIIIVRSHMLHTNSSSDT